LGSKPPGQLISLTPAALAPPGELQDGPQSRALIIHTPVASRELDVNRVPVQVNASTVAYLKDAAWVDRPARLFRDLLAETIRAKAGRMVIDADEYSIEGRQELSGRLLDMSYDAPDQSVVVRFDALLEEANGEVRTRRFEATIPGVAPTAAAVAPALNEAANTVAAQVAEWLS
jgi:cholesterol transport system auxiliary component